MTRAQFKSGKPFVVKNIPCFDWVYTEFLFGGEVRISNGKNTQTVQVEEINENYFVVDCWLNSHTDGKIMYTNCELK